MSKIGTRQEYHTQIGKGILGKEDCPFCDSGKIKNTLIHTFQNWSILLNKYPYSGNEHHLMVVPKRHIIFGYELNSEEIKELQDIYRFMKDFFEGKEEDYFMAARETMGNRSVEHYHMHFIPGRLQGKFLRCMLQNQGYPIEAEVQIQK